MNVKKQKEIDNYIVHGSGAKLVSNWEQNMLYTKSQEFLCRRMISMLAGLKVSSWACKCVFYVPEQSPKRENAGLQLQK